MEEINLMVRAGLRLNTAGECLVRPHGALQHTHTALANTDLGVVEDGNPDQYF